MLLQEARSLRGGFIRLAWVQRACEGGSPDFSLQMRDAPGRGERSASRRDAISTRPGCIRKSRRKWRAMVWIIMFPKRKTRSLQSAVSPVTPFYSFFRAVSERERGIEKRRFSFTLFLRVHYPHLCAPLLNLTARSRHGSRTASAVCIPSPGGTLLPHRALTAHWRSFRGVCPLQRCCFLTARTASPPLSTLPARR